MWRNCELGLRRYIRPQVQRYKKTNAEKNGADPVKEQHKPIAFVLILCNMFHV